VLHAIFARIFRICCLLQSKISLNCVIFWMPVLLEISVINILWGYINPTEIHIQPSSPPVPLDQDNKTVLHTTSKTPNTTAIQTMSPTTWLSNGCSLVFFVIIQPCHIFQNAIHEFIFSVLPYALHISRQYLPMIKQYGTVDDTKNNIRHYHLYHGIDELNGILEYGVVVE
jgi:hypothetical protein